MCLSLECEGDTPCGDSLIHEGRGERLRFCVHLCMEGEISVNIVRRKRSGGYMSVASV